MANEFVAKNGLISQNNTIVSGSLTVTQGITGSLSGSVTLATTASYVLQAVSASFATTASYALNAEGGSGGISQGKVVAIATGNSNLF
jgi:hypothetical protein